MFYIKRQHLPLFAQQSHNVYTSVLCVLTIWFFCFEIQFADFLFRFKMFVSSASITDNSNVWSCHANSHSIPTYTQFQLNKIFCRVQWIWMNSLIKMMSRIKVISIYRLQLSKWKINLPQNINHKNIGGSNQSLYLLHSFSIGVGVFLSSAYIGAMYTVHLAQTHWQ